MLLTTALNGQGIKGKIVDEETGKPMAGVNIYLNGTYQGTSSNSDGSFLLNSNEANIPLIISYIGYETQTVTNYYGKEQSIRLKRKANVLKEVTIGFDGMSREEKIKIFLNDFIGTTNKKCTIENIDDISFTYHRKTGLLTASADQPLIILNKKLGYKISYSLLLFRHLPNEVSFQGNYFFAEDTIGLKPKDLKKVLSAREDVYLGSRMHFIRSLWNDKLKENKFKIYLKDSLAMYKDIAVTHGDEKFIRYISYVYIDYRGQGSYLQQPEKGHETFVAANGFYDPNIVWGGEMASQRVGEMLPFEFKPSNH